MNRKIYLILGLVLYTASTYAYEFSEITLPNNFKESRLMELDFDEDGSMFILSESQIFSYNGFEFKPILPIDSFEGLSGLTILDNVLHFFDNRGNLYRKEDRQVKLLHHFEEPVNALTCYQDFLVVGTAGAGCFIYSNDTLFKLSQLTDDYIHDLTLYQDELWIATDNGINIYSEGQYSRIGVNQGLSDYMVIDLYNSSDSVIAALCYNGDLNIIRSDSIIYKPLYLNSKNSFILRNKSNWTIGLNKLYHEDKIVPTDFQAAKIYLDQANNLWIITSKNKLIKSNPLFNNQSFDLINLHSAIFHSNNSVWLCADTGVQIFDKEFNKINFIPNVSEKYPVVCMFESPDKRVFAGTQGAGLMILDEQGGLIEVINESKGLVNNHVLHLELLEDYLFLATLGGVVIYNIKSDEIVNEFNEKSILTYQYVYSALPLSQNHFYLASDGKGLLEVDEGKVREVKFDILPENTTILSLEKGPDFVWLAVADIGVIGFNDEDTIFLNKLSGISSTQIIGIYANDDYAYFANEFGLDVLNKNDLSFKYYHLGKPKEADLQNLSVSAGQLMVAYSNELMVFNLNYKLPDYPLISFLQPKLFYNPIDTNKHVFLFNENQFSFDFEALWFANPLQIYYKYKLLGLENNWNVSQSREVNYGNLSPGHYTFQIAAGLNEDFKPQNVVSYSFKVRKPFWQQWWFLIFMVFFMTSFIYVILKIQENRVLAKEKEAKQKVIFEYENLKSQVNPHFLFNSFNSLINLIEENPMEAAVYVEKLSNFFRNILKFENRETITLGEELETVKDYFAINKLRFEILIHLRINIPETYFDKLVVPLSLQMLVENAIKHNEISSKNPLFIEILIEDNYIIVRNNKKKKNMKEESSSFGLRSIKERYRILSKKELIILDEKNEFTVKIPYIN